MKPGLKNIAAGFLVSFTGSVPLGYLNLIGFSVYKDHGQGQAVLYLVGVLLAEVAFMYSIIYFTSRITFQKNFLKRIEFFSILLLLLLAYWYWPQKGNATEGNTIAAKIIYTPFITGMVLSLLNFIQVPFWAGWNLYLTSNGFASFTGVLKHYFVAGALTGTFLGMQLFIYLLASVPVTVLNTKVLSYIYPVVFLSLFLYQLVKLISSLQRINRI
ncbi:hypothetical protein CHU92_03725 [Flavobacterium cyanobacteriorum]|uniref:Lysine transporter LysE n=1 Tax=Flavobacterium cyanobacteriorum TaxID=2022802 RepID=A0A255ZQ81_9FLAO|nr:hypothetical protein [Flavobacterium cyanobacteriorum]OYQ43035.1 hypothetical protein CHU92_03725 [Flavobacterium cyanobacteriorum]